MAQSASGGIRLVSAVGAGSLIVAGLAVAPSHAAVNAVDGTLAHSVNITARAGSGVTIKGSLAKSWRGGKVVLLTPSGRAYSATVKSNGKWQLKVAKSQVKGATLQLVKANNQYSGPVVLSVTSYKAGKQKRYAAHLTLKGSSVDLGKLKVTSGAGIVTKKSAGKAASTSAVVRARSKSGVPFGAGRAGLVSSPGAARSMQTRAAGATGSGDDLDRDGVPNTFDVDDNGNLSLDMTDTSSTGGRDATARLNPWSTLVLDLNSQINAHRAPISSTDIANAVGGANTFALAFFIDQPYLFPGGPEASLGRSATAVKNAWIDCGGLSYCGTSNPSAQVGGLSETPSFPSGAWAAYQGQRWSGGVASAPLRTSPRNSLFALIRGGSEAPTWVGSVQPRTGSSTLANFRPGDVYTLNYRVNDEPEDRSVNMMLNPYFVTVPALKNQSAAVSGNALNLSGGVASLQVYRPQRQTVTGESGDWRDIGNLHYGLVISTNSGEYGCAPSRYSGLSSVTAHNDPSGSLNLWPLQDNAGSDMSVESGADGLAFNVDVQRCATDNGLTAGTYNASLVATGESMTGGANRATLGGMTVTVS